MLPAGFQFIVVSLERMSKCVIEDGSNGCAAASVVAALLLLLAGESFLLTDNLHAGTCLLRWLKAMFHVGK
jgi:hypothetical protein